MVTDKENFGYGKAGRVEITSDKDLMVSHVDGEEFSRKGKHFVIEILPSAVRLFR